MDWFKAHAWNIFFAAMLVSISVGTWTEQVRQTSAQVSDVDRRLRFLEDRYSGESSRLSSVYMTRELSLQQYQDISRQLDEIKEELAAIRRQVR
jgi:hypothetical protein